MDKTFYQRKIKSNVRKIKEKLNIKISKFICFLVGHKLKSSIPICYRCGLHGHNIEGFFNYGLFKKNI